MGGRIRSKSSEVMSPATRGSVRRSLGSSMTLRLRPHRFRVSQPRHRLSMIPLQLSHGSDRLTTTRLPIIFAIRSRFQPLSIFRVFSSRVQLSAGQVSHSSPLSRPILDTIGVSKRPIRRAIPGHTVPPGHLPLMILSRLSVRSGAIPI